MKRAFLIACIVALGLACGGADTQSCDTHPSCIPVDWSCGCPETLPSSPTIHETACIGCVRGFIERWIAVTDDAGYCGIAQDRFYDLVTCGSS